jgi:Protein of unknown function (DUF3455)
MLPRFSLKLQEEQVTIPRSRRLAALLLAILPLAILPLAAMTAGPPIPESLTPPASAALLLTAPAEGVQIYVCQKADQGYGWAFKAPEAALFDATGRQILHHFAGPSWQSPDGTLLTAKVTVKEDSPITGAIPWLLLAAKVEAGSGPLAKTSLIRRIYTKGGSAPVAGCDAAHDGEEARMRYGAVYEFYAEGP